ncbi:glycosyltransferase family 32 protein [Periconia macrospinosa]|uniref:Glycosyltransferase family 32 protein n=1 Tax=Periconia macrospinosa TaxID=97972 RepID=A0A2V1DVP4_9PLEO|nr:glycosyltransferase family 32 protein [Periconia macrospinosa]
MLPSPKRLTFRTSGYYILQALCVLALFYYLRTTSIQSIQPQNSHPKSDGIPKIIWYKLGPKGLNSDTREWTDTCIRINPNYRMEFLTDEDADEYVKKSWKFRPDIVDIYLGLTIPIVKADLLRYLLLFDQGGIWSDLDISCEGVPVDDWIPQQHKAAGLVVGWEFDMGWGTAFIRQFASWTIMAKPGSPHMLQVIEDITASLRGIMEKQEIPIQNVTLTMTGEIVDFSGPRRFTNSVIASIGKSVNRTIKLDEISQLLQPKQIGDVLILPGVSFAASANTYTDEEKEQLPPKLVTHHYAGTWKNPEGGETV